MKFETPALSKKCTVKTKKNLQSRHVYRENTPPKKLGPPGQTRGTKDRKTKRKTHEKKN